MTTDRVVLTRGFDIKLRGQATSDDLSEMRTNAFALKPTDLAGLSPIPKLNVREDDHVRAGDSLFFDKTAPTTQFCAPVSGRIVEIRRAARRAISEVRIEADDEIDFREFQACDPERASLESIVARMLEAGVWPLLRQRPFNVMADPTVRPRDIFISCFDTAPLAPDYNQLMLGKEEKFQLGLRVLARLTDGDVHLGVADSSPEMCRRAEHVKVREFSGPHPAGTVGVQIHHVRPINKGEVVWTIRPQDVAVIGGLFRDGIFDAERTVALTGNEVMKTGYWRTRIGASITPLIQDNLTHTHVRFISGNVLTGRRIEPDGFVGLFDDQVTVIEEGDTPEFLGWLLPSYARPSMSRTFLNFLRPDRTYEANSSEHGERRAYVMTGQYERVVPMDLYPQHLIKSILYRDFDQMEGLGIYEVVEEDLALCEFVCTSKQPVQQILRDGIDAIRAEG